MDLNPSANNSASSGNKNSSKRKTPIQHVRNIGIAAHIDAGKTTTTERILFYSGVVHKVGEVHEGAATTDWMEQERERGITITSAAISCNWINKGGLFANLPHTINIIDTPGHVDFTAEVERSLRVLDGAVAVFCGVAGVQPQSETVWRQMDKYNIPRIVYINKMDRTGADYLAALESIRTRLGANVHPLFLNIGSEEQFSGLIDLIEEKAYIYKDAQGMTFEVTEIPAEMKEAADHYRTELIEALSDISDKIAELYLEGKPIEANDLRAAVREGTLKSSFIGAIPGSSFKNKGIQMVLDSIVDYLPSPADLPAIEIEQNGEKVNIIADDSHEPVGLVFKLMTDPYIGKLVFFRVYSGTITKGMVLRNPRTRKTERVSRLVLMKANDRIDIEAAYAGDICALIGPRNAVTGDTFCGESLDVSLEPPTFPEPVISMSIEPKSKSDQEQLSKGLQALSEEDPTFRVTSDQETGQTLISGMGELHLDIIRDRLIREFKVEADVGRPQIAYRETITMASEGEGKFIRQTGGHGQYGHAVIKMEPAERGSGIVILNEIVGGAIPKEFIKPTEEGLREGAQNGVVAGYPVVDCCIHIVDGSYHEVDSSELAFKMAGIFAFKAAMERAKPILLEPIMEVEVTTPEEYLGDVMGDINRRRGQIQKSETQKGVVLVTANVPLEMMFGYATDIRSLTKGRASYSMKPSHFEQVSNNLLSKIVETRSKAPARS